MLDQTVSWNESKRKLDYCDSKYVDGFFIRHIYGNSHTLVHNESSITNEKGHIKRDEIPINYCPMCGRKLI
jgi:hypothetical protein